MKSTQVNNTNDCVKDLVLTGPTWIIQDIFSTLGHLILHLILSVTVILFLTQPSVTAGTAIGNIHIGGIYFANYQELLFPILPHPLHPTTF